MFSFVSMMRCHLVRTVRCLFATAALFALGCSHSGSGAPTGAAAFVGVWMPVGGEAGTSVSSRMCGTAAPTTSPITSPLTVTADGTQGLLFASTTDGCMVILQVTGNTATALQDQMCTLGVGDAGSADVETIDTYVLTVDGNVLTSAVTGMTADAHHALDASVKDTDCVVSAEGMYEKQ
jgi:hypothetical protein